MDGIQIIRWLSSDDTAAVYEAADATGRPFVYTVGHRPAARPQVFEDWAARLRSVRHAHIAPVAGAGLTNDGRPYVLCGTGTTTLAERLVSAPPGVDEVARTATALADALATAHAAGLRHGTVCPSTVLYTADGTPQLTGFDMCAPELVKTARPGLYTAPELDDGPAADVYALAATTYVAVGGTLPYADDPSSPELRRRGITELPHVPAELIVTLRTALNPEPRTRPGADLLRDMLSTVEVHHKTATTALPMILVGSDVRAVNHGVAEVNKAVTGALPRLGDEHPPVPPGFAAVPARPSAPAPRPAPTPPVPRPAPTPVQVSRPRKRTGTKVLVSILALLVLAGGGAAAWYYNNRADEPAAGGGTNDGGPASIEEVDFTNYIFSVPYSDQHIDMKNGLYEFTDPDAGRVRWRLGGDPVYADADGDGDTDAAIVLEREYPDQHGLVVPWIIVYTWDPSTEATKANQSVAGICDVVSVTSADEIGFDVTVKSSNPYEGCENKDVSTLPSESFTVGAKDGWIAQTGPVPGSATRCTWIKTDSTIAMSGAPKFGVHIGPAQEAAEITGVVGYTSRQPDTKEPIKWQIASIDLDDGSTTCGWIAVSDLVAS